MAYSTAVQNLIDKFRRMSAMTLQSDSSDSDYIQMQALTDAEIYDCLENAVDDFNLFPPLLTEFTVESLLDTNSSYSKLIILGAQIYAIILLEFYEIGMYFQVSDDGHSITRNKFGHYSSMKNQLWGLYEKMITIRKQQYSMNAMGIRGLFSTVATAPWQAYRGLRATRYSLYSSTRNNLR